MESDTVLCYHMLFTDLNCAVAVLKPVCSVSNQASKSCYLRGVSVFGACAQYGCCMLLPERPGPRWVSFLK